MKKTSLALAALSAVLTLGCARTGNSGLEPAVHRQPDNQTVRSADGTRIGFTRVGSGPVPVVIVHGSLNTGAEWMPVATALAEHCTCYVMDRWGRGGSDHHTDYSLEREIEDIGAVLKVAGPEAYLLGHSSGAIYTLEAARRYPLAGLVLYEPPLNAFLGPFVEELMPRLRVAARAERFEDVVSIFLRDEAETPEGELSRLQKSPLWAHLVALAPHSMREWEELAEARLTVDRYSDVAVPTLLLTGTLTKDHRSFATETLESTLPNARMVLLDGQGHGANLGAPDMVAKAIAELMRETSR